MGEWVHAKQKGEVCFTLFFFFFFTFIYISFIFWLVLGEGLFAVCLYTEAVRF